MSFFEYYESLVETSVKETRMLNGTEEQYMVNEMVKHLEKEGYAKLCAAVSSLNEDVEKKVLAITEIYTSFLKLAKTDILALEDQLL